MRLKTLVGSGAGSGSGAGIKIKKIGSGINHSGSATLIFMLRPVFKFVVQFVMLFRLPPKLRLKIAFFVSIMRNSEE